MPGTVKYLRIRFADGTFHSADLNMSTGKMTLLRVSSPHMAYVWNPNDAEQVARCNRTAQAVGGTVEEYDYVPICAPRGK